jgi:hypothetical protein
MGREFRGLKPSGKTKLFKVWTSMKQRCQNSSDPSYVNYGARGIFVCEKWSNDFHRFRIWAEDNGYKEGLTIDRINNDDGYYPENCRWTDRKTQNINKRQKARMITVRGVTRSMQEWVKIMGHENSAVIRTRLCNGWDEERAVLYPVFKRGEAPKKSRVELSEVNL